MADFANDSEANQLAALAQLSANRTYVAHANRLMFAAVYLAALALLLGGISNGGGVLRALIPIDSDELPHVVLIILAWVAVGVWIGLFTFAALYHVRMLKWGRSEAARISLASTWFELYTMERARRFADPSVEGDKWRARRPVRWGR